MSTKFVKTTDQRRLLLTGGSSGIGFEAARQLTRMGHDLTLICRSQDRGRHTLDRLSDIGADPDQVRVLPMDLGDLDEVERGCRQLLERGEHFDGLILNAGLQLAGLSVPRRSAQGIELTFAVNHLAHQWMASRLQSLLVSSADPQVVITASDVHNPESGGGRVGRPAALGTLQGLESGAGFSMVDGSDHFDADKAYKDSKLCNLLMGRMLEQRLRSDGHSVPVLAWSPGLVIPRSSEGFFRTSRQQNPFGIALFSFVARDLLRLTESVQTAGDYLACLSTQKRYRVPGFSYYSNHLVRPGQHRFEVVDTSEEARDSTKAAKLWELSEALIQHSLTS